MSDISEITGTKELVIRNLETNKEKSYGVAKDYQIAPGGKVLVLKRDYKNDNQIGHSIVWVDL